ncbi:MAG TPA: TetR/AcrR family transcriptional regulator [Acidimicrobiales bacterium]|nr:TetR/AcrR family transcriptional regulator [Acidimicrobiales bacterium]
MSTQDGEKTTESRQAIAARNVEAILDAAEALIVAGAPLNFSVLAARAGVSRPTVYSHFPGRADLLGAVMERSVRLAVAAIESAGPGEGPPSEALERVIRCAWGQLARHHDIAGALGAEMPSGAVHAGHHDALSLFEPIVARGRADGSFRQDLPVAWLVHACVGLMHAAAAAVHSGQMQAQEAREALTASVIELCVGPGPPDRAVRRAPTPARRASRRRGQGA